MKKRNGTVETVETVETVGVGGDHFVLFSVSHTTNP